jgi:hypothetical protein
MEEQTHGFKTDDFTVALKFSDRNYTKPFDMIREVPSGSSFSGVCIPNKTFFNPESSVSVVLGKSVFLSFQVCLFWEKRIKIYLS